MDEITHTIPEQCQSERMEWPNGDSLTDKQRAFLAAYIEVGRVNVAAKAVGISRDTHYRWVRNPKYAEAFKMACAMAADEFEAEAVRRGVEGLKRYKFTAKGEPILHPVTGEPYYEHVYSDSLLMALLKANNPEKFGDKVEQTHKGVASSPVRIYHIPDNGRSDEYRVEIANGGEPEFIRQVLDALDDEQQQQMEAMAEKEAMMMYDNHTKGQNT